MIDFSRLEQYRENNRIEAKRALGGLPHSIWETYSAFANTLGGILLLGVEEYEDRSLHTVDLPDPERMVREFWELVNDPKTASVNILSLEDVTIQEVDGDHIIVITIPRADRLDKPVYVGGDMTSGTYRRSGEGDYRCSEEERRAMLRDAAGRTQDMRRLGGLGLDALDPDSVRAYRREMRRLRPGHGWEELADEAFLENLGAAGTGSDGALHPTAAGLLLFGKEEEILREYPNYRLDYREEGRRTRGEGVRIGAASGEGSGNVYRFFRLVRDRWRRIGAGRPAPGEDAALRHALREALANCLVNADYYGRGGILIRRLPGEIVLSNPGVFRIRLRAARGGGVSDPRNSALHRMFRLLDVGEGAGSGVPGILRVWRDRNWAEPRVTQTFDPDRTTLHLPLRAPREEDSKKTGGPDTALRASEEREQVIQYLTDHAAAGSAEIAEQLGRKESRVLEILAGLAAGNIVTAEGEGRDRVYRLRA